MCNYSYQTISRLQDANSCASIVSVGKLIGEGGFGKVYTVSSTNSSGVITDSALKCSKRTYSIKWEVLIHEILRKKLTPDEYERIAVPPLKLYYLKDACALLFPLGKLGTLWTLANGLIGIGANEKEKEHIAALMCREMMISMQILHRCSIVHSDMKLDNWLIYWDEHRSRLSLRLIDFGKSMLFKACYAGANVGIQDIYLSSLREPARSVDFYHLDVVCHYSREIDRGELEVPHNVTYGIQRDLYCAANCLHQLLHFEKLIPRIDKWNNVRPNTSLKRYWRCEVWEPIFYNLLNCHSDFYNENLYNNAIVGVDEILAKTMDTSCFDKLNVRLHEYLRSHSIVKL